MFLHFSAIGWSNKGIGASLKKKAETDDSAPPFFGCSTLTSA
jgi:hypothetical protein